MKEGWKYMKLGEIATTINGLWKGKKEPFVNVGVIRNANFTKDITLDFSKIEYLNVEERQYQKRKLQKGDLIVEKSGGSEKQPVGRTVLFNAEGEFSVSNFTSILRINNQNEITPEFLYKYLLYIYREGWTKEMQNATTGIHNIIFEKFLAISTPIPPLSEQQRIVTYLDAEFAKIEALKANAEKQLQAAKDLFQAALKDLLTPKEGWVEKKLKEVGKTQTGSTPSKSNANYYGNYIPFIRPAELNFNNNGEIKYDSEVKLSESGANCSRVIDENSVLMCCIGSIGKIGFTTLKVTCNQQINTITPCSDYNARFIYYALLSPDFQEEAIKIANSARATLAIISKGKWENIFIPIPPRKEQQRIADRLDALSANVKALQMNYTETITLCNDLKQALLKKVFEEDG